MVTDGRPHTGYLAYHNLVQQGGFKQGDFYNQHFDVHGSGKGGYGGIAGEFSPAIRFQLPKPTLSLLLDTERKVGQS